MGQRKREKFQMRPGRGRQTGRVRAQVSLLHPFRVNQCAKELERESSRRRRRQSHFLRFIYSNHWHARRLYELQCNVVPLPLAHTKLVKHTHKLDAGNSCGPLSEPISGWGPNSRRLGQCSVCFLLHSSTRPGRASSRSGLASALEAGGGGGRGLQSTQSN